MSDWSTDSRFTKTARVVRVLLERSDELLTMCLKIAYVAGHSEMMEWRFLGVTRLRFLGKSTELFWSGTPAV